ncbi:MAG TPA: hypothetical protein VGH01_03310, partial [Jatrophihabitantaceae bacterium]
GPSAAIAGAPAAPAAPRADCDPAWVEAAWVEAEQPAMTTPATTPATAATADSTARLHRHCLIGASSANSVRTHASDSQTRRRHPDVLGQGRNPATIRAVAEPWLRPRECKDGQEASLGGSHTEVTTA